jgi:hypothetical protein
MTKKPIVRKPKGNLIKEIDAAIALLTRARALAATDGASPKAAAKQVPAEKKAKRTLSASAREAIAIAQKKRWAKVRRQKKQAERAALAK